MVTDLNQLPTSCPVMLSALLTEQEEKGKQKAQGLRGSEEIIFQLLSQAKQTWFRDKIFNWLSIKLVFSSEKHEQKFNASFPPPLPKLP